MAKTKQGITIGTMLACGCCGQAFDVWIGYKDQDQDKGYGICLSCQEKIEADNEAQFNKGFKVFREALNSENQLQWDKLDRDTKKALLIDAIDEGLMTHHVKRA